MSTLDRTWLMLQLTDSAFPTGAFAHSSGLEAARQTGDVPGRDELVAFLHATLQQAAGSTAAVVAMVVRGPLRFDALDRFCDITLLNAVANRASRSQGQALLAAGTRVFALPAIVALQERVRAERLPCHLAPVFGAVHGAMGIDAETTVNDFLFVTLRGLISAAVRLGIVGPLEGQAIQFEVSKGSLVWVEKAMSIDDEEQIASTSPLLDYYQSIQEMLYSRLFIS
jgi:urease accessory protein